MEVIIIKLGGSLVTNKKKPMSLRRSVIQRLAHELAELYNSNPNYRFIIGNGAGSFGHYMVHETAYREDQANMLAVANIRVATAQLNQYIIKSLVDAGLPASSFTPCSFIYESNGRVQTDSAALFNYLQQGMVPIVYGDIITQDKSTRIISTEEILEQLAQAAAANGYTIRCLIYAASVEGVLDEDNKLIPRINASNNTVKFGATAGYDVTGGMAQKVAAGRRALNLTDQVYILDGRVPGNLTKAVGLKTIGTRLTR